MFILNAFVVEAVLFAPRESDRLVREMHVGVGMLVSSAWSESFEWVNLWEYLDSASVEYRGERVPVAWLEGPAPEPNQPFTPETCIKLWTCRIKCDAPH